MYYVKLIKNKSFYFFNHHRFIHGKEEQVDEKIFNYLRKITTLKFVKVILKLLNPKKKDL
jgi:hypothetical protein